MQVGLPRLRLVVVDILPHDPEAFTQGLCVVDGALLESTGLHGQSTLRRLDPKSGCVLDSHPLPEDVWAEGIARLGREIVQLSYRTGVAYRYAWPSLAPLTPAYSYAGEGWGLAAADDRLFMSDGTASIAIRTAGFAPIGRLRIRRNGVELRRINDLTYDGDSLFANVLRERCVYRICPATGRITGMVDCRELVRRAGPRAEDEVLNGIAHDPATHSFYLTGKRWPELYRVRFEA